MTPISFIRSLVVIAIFLSSPICATAQTPDGSKLICRWKSDVERTMEFNKEHARLEDDQISALQQLFGNLTIEFSRDTVALHMSAISIRRGDKLVEEEEFTERFSYRVLGKTDSAVAIKTVKVDEPDIEALGIWHFEGEHIWTYVGDSPFGLLHVREYFRRVGGTQ